MQLQRSQAPSPSCSRLTSWPPSACAPACRPRGSNSSAPGGGRTGAARGRSKPARWSSTRRSAPARSPAPRFFDNRVDRHQRGRGRPSAGRAPRQARSTRRSRSPCASSRSAARLPPPPAGCRWPMRWPSTAGVPLRGPGQRAQPGRASRSARSAARCRERQAQLARLVLVGRAGHTQRQEPDRVARAAAAGAAAAPAAQDLRPCRRIGLAGSCGATRVAKSA